MKILDCPIKGLLEIVPDIYKDSRGFFYEIWNARRYGRLGIPEHFVQDNHSFSCKGTLRGLHFQRQYPQGKLIFALTGTVFDVAVDLRQNSPTFGQWATFTLSSQTKNQLWIPPGFAHGFCVLSAEAGIIYKCTELYHPEDEFSIRWDDPEFAIPWPVSNPILSIKDKNAPSFRDVRKLLDA